jgi:hypothetical protein
MDELYWSLWSGVILGAEEDGSEGGDENSEDESDADENEGSDGDGSNDENESSKEDDIAKLQKALASERRLNKLKDRQINKLTKAKTAESNEEQQNLETAQNREREAIARAEKLAAGLLQRDLNAAIEREARAMKFLDPADAIALVDRTAIVFDQDEDDPTDIDIDQDTVKAAVKSLATRKPHYISKGTDDGEPTGSAFGGKKRKSKDADDELRELYPSL